MKEENLELLSRSSFESLDFYIPRPKMLNAHGNSQWKAKMGIIKYLRNLGFDRGNDLREKRQQEGLEIFFDFFEITAIIKAPRRNRIDPPNYYPTVKPLVDGLTSASWWKDDNYAHMLETRFRYGGLSGATLDDGSKDLTMFRVILEIREINNPEDYITSAEICD